MNIGGTAVATGGKCSVRDADGFWTRLGDVSVHGQTLGRYAAGDPDRPSVLLLHGIEDGWAGWTAVARHLVPEFRCVAVDLPWRSGNDYGWRHRAPEQWIADAAESLPERPAALVAHSFSANALLQGMDRGVGALADAMVLISPFYRPPHIPVNWHTFERSLAEFRTTMTAGLRVRIGPRAERMEPEVFAAMARTMLDGVGVLGFLAVFEQFAAACDLDLSGRPGRVLVLAGSHDPGIAGERIEWLRRAVPHAALDVRADYTHFCHLDRPDLVGPLVTDFLRKGTASMATLDGTSGPITARPRYESANISTYIGFKNFMLIAEDAVLQHLRELGHGAQRLFERHGLGTTITHSSMRLTATMHTDDQVVAHVTPVAAKPGQGAAFDVKLTTRRTGDEADVKLLNGRVRVQFVTEKDGLGAGPVPAELVPFVVAETAGEGAAESVAVVADAEISELLAAASGNDFLWAYKIPYYACHYYTRIQSSAYVKLLEEAVDRYLEHAGLSITGLLEQRDWIPVVSRARVDMHADAFMGEELLITFTVDDIIKDTLFTARMQARVLRGDQLVHVASATIMHGYVMARGEAAFTDVITLDAATQAALLSGRAR